MIEKIFVSASKTIFETVRDSDSASVLPLAEQIVQLGIGIGELLAFHCADFEKAEAQGIPSDTAAYEIDEEIKQYSELGGIIKQQEQVRRRSPCPLTFQYPVVFRDEIDHVCQQQYSPYSRAFPSNALKKLPS